MGKVVIDMSMSLDGYIAAPNDNPEQGLGEDGMRLHNWGFDNPGVFDGLIENTGAVIMGRRARGRDPDPSCGCPARRRPPDVRRAPASNRAGADGALRGRRRGASRVSRGSVADHAGRSATTRHENLRSIGPGQHEFVNGDYRESAGVCKRRVGVKEID